jgi:hypothetical protein
MSHSRARIDNSLAAIRASGPFSEREVYLLREVVRVLDELGVACWLDQGALLGIFRDGGLYRGMPMLTSVSGMKTFVR